MYKYNPKSRCPKCDGETYDKHEREITDEDVSRSRAISPMWFVFRRPERLERKCRRCSYLWYEATLDMEVTTDAAQA